MKAIKFIIAMMLLIATLPAVFAGNIEHNHMYAYGSNAPIANTQAQMFTCTEPTCRNVAGGAWYNQNSGASNVLTIEYPGASTLTYYAKYFFTPTYLPWGGVFYDQGDGWEGDYDVYMYRANGCHSPVDSMAVTNTVYAYEPLAVNYQALVDSTITSAFRRSSAPPFYTPAGFDNYFSALTDVTLNIYNPAGTLVFTNTTQVNLFTDSQQEVVFSWTPTVQGDGYRAVITTNVIDDQCATRETQGATKTFNVLPRRPTDECYTMLQNLDYDPEFPEVDIDTITFTAGKVSNYADNAHNPTAIPADVTYTIREGKSNPAGAVADSGVLNLGATATTTYTPFSFTWLPDEEGWYTAYVTGIANSALCNGKTNYDDGPLTVEIYVNPHPLVSVFFEIDDIATGLPIQGATITFNGVTAVTDAVGKASFSNVPGRQTYSYTVTHPNYNTISGAEYIPEVDRYLYLSMTRINNQAPQFSTIAPNVACVGQLYTYDADAVDAQGDPFTFSLIAQPAGMTVNAASGLVSWTPAATGSTVYVLRATDDHGASNDQHVVVSVRDCSANTAPQISTTAPGGFVCLGNTYTYDVDYTDAEGDAGVFSLTTSPAGMTVNANGIISWVANNVGFNPVTVRVTDGRDATLFDQEPFTVTVVDCSVALTATANDMTCFPGETIFMDGDAAGGLPPYDYAWDLNDDGTYEALEYSPAFTCGNVIGTEYDVNFRVTDAAAQVDTDSATITVVQYMGPRFTSDPVRTAYPDEQYRYDANAFDPDGDSITYSLDAASIARGMAISAVNGVITYTPTRSEIGLVYPVTVTATSIDGSATQNYNLSIIERGDDFGFYVNDLYVGVKVATGEYATQGSEMQLLFRLENQGNNEFNGVQIMTYVDDLGMYDVIGPFDIDNGDQLDRRVYMDVPENARPGIHYFRVIASTDLGWREVYREFTVTE